MELFNEPIIQKKTLSDVIKNDNVITNTTMVGGSFNGGKITIGSGNNIFTANKDGIFLGSSSFDTAPFRVDMQGNLVASSATIAGDIVSDNYITGVSGYKLEYSTGIGYFNNIVITGGTIGGQSVSNIANVSNSTALTAPAELSVTETAITIANDGTVSANITLSWTEETDPRFDHYQIRYKKSSFTYYQYINSNSNTITIDGLIPNTSYDFAVSSVNKYGIPSTYSSTVTSTTATSTTAPSTVDNVSATGGIQYVIIEWTSNSETDLSSYNVYRNTTNDSGTAILISNIKGNYLVDGNLVGGTEYFYWVKAVNTSGLVSTDFSTVASATPRNVTSDDVVTLAGSKVLIDGTTYLSNWRKSGDLTKIDGGSISTGSITTAQLNFTPVQSTDVIAKINASEEGIQISGEHIAISGSTTFDSGYDPTAKVDKLGGSYASASSGARVLIFPDTNTGLQIIDNGGADVFKAIIGGDNVGDVIIGNYTGGQGIFYDKSEAKTIFKGSMTAGDITGVAITGGTISIGNLNNIFKADSNGIYLGNSTFASAPFRVDMAGNLTATSATITGAITTGAGSSINGTYIDSIAANKITAGTGIVNNLSILSTLTMGSSGTNGIIQSYGWNGTSAGFKINGGATPSFELIGGTITGGTIQTATSGRRIEIKTEGEYENSIAIFDSTGNIGIHLFDNSIFGGWTNSAIIFDQSHGLRVAFPFPTADQGYIYFLRNSSQSSGAAAPVIKGYPSLAIEVDSITLNGTTRTSWPTSFSGNLSDLYINTTKSWGSYGITGLGTITPYSNNSYSLGSSSYKWNNVYSTYGTFDYLGKSLNANSYNITNAGAITPYSNNSYDLGSTSYYWRNVYGINIIPSGSYTSYLGNSSYYWDYLYVDTIRGAGGTNSIEIENNAFTRHLFPAYNVTYDIGSSSFFYKNVFTQSLRLRTGQSTNPSYSGEIRYYDATGGGFRGVVGSWLGQFDMTAK